MDNDLLYRNMGGVVLCFELKDVGGWKISVQGFLMVRSTLISLAANTPYISAA